MTEQRSWRIKFVNQTSETVFGAEPRVSRDGKLLLVVEYYGGGMSTEKASRSFVLANVLTWEQA